MLTSGIEFPTEGTMGERRAQWIKKVRSRRLNGWRNARAERIARTMVRLPFFDGLPKRMVMTYCELMQLSQELREQIQHKGLINSEGKLFCAVDQWRLIKRAEIEALKAMVEVAHLMHQDGRTAGIDLQTLLPQLQPSNAPAERPDGETERGLNSDSVVLAPIPEDVGNDHKPDPLALLEARIAALENENADLRAKLRSDQEITDEIASLRKLAGIDDE
jgi:hypothetical protein